MPISYLAKLTAPKRTAKSNLHLGVTLAFIAGALNAGGFLAVGEYTSHMTGMVSAAADNLVLGQSTAAFAALLMLLSFIVGSATTAIMVNYAKRNALSYIYTPVLLLEAILLLVFGVIGSRLLDRELITVSLTAVLLCYLMGLQNALITKISNAEIRTTHVTGLVTDIGIELGKMLYWNRQDKHPTDAAVSVNVHKLHLHIMLVCSFFSGGLVGAAGFKYIGFISTLPLALALVTLGLAPRIKNAIK
jgi:uncharacterized membrane protein YoaK (UPF0700 family)